MVYTLVLEANAEGIVSSSLTWRTIFFTLTKTDMHKKKLTPTRNDTDKCVEMIGNRFNLVLVASARVRELRRGSRPLVDNSNHSTPPVLALSEIEAGKVGIEYLRKVR
jgi:DNA-directed RNA polymerase subunit omega